MTLDGGVSVLVVLVVTTSYMILLVEDLIWLNFVSHARAKSVAVSAAGKVSKKAGYPKEEANRSGEWCGIIQKRVSFNRLSSVCALAG